MRLVWSLLMLVAPVWCQFDLFSSNKEPEEITDTIGMRDALSQWNQALRNIAQRKMQHMKVDPRQLTPHVVDQEDLKRAQPKKKGEIINASLLNILLPRIKGQPAFSTTPKPTTTTKATTVTTTTTTTTIPPTTTTEATSTTTETTTTESTTEQPATTRETNDIIDDSARNEIPEKENSKEKTTTKRDVSAVTDAPEKETTNKPKSAAGSNQFTVSFNTANKDLLNEKVQIEAQVLNIIEKKVEEQDKVHQEEGSGETDMDLSEFNHDKPDDYKVEKKKKGYWEKLIELADAELKKIKAEEVSSAEKIETKAKAKSEEVKEKHGETVELRNMLKEKESDSQEMEKNEKHEEESTTSKATTTTTHKPKPTTTRKAETKKTTSAKKTSAKVTTTVATSTKAPETTTTEAETTTMKSVEEMDLPPSTTEKTIDDMTSEELEEEVAKEAKEIIGILKTRSSKEEKTESKARSLLVDRLREFLEMESKKLHIEADKEIDQLLTSEMGEKAKSAEQTTTEAAKTEENTTESDTTQKTTTTAEEETTTTEEMTTTLSVEETKDPSQQSSKEKKPAIPEAEEESESGDEVGTHSISFVQQDPQIDNVQEDIPETTTTTTTTVAPSTLPVFNFQNNQKLTNMIGPISNIIDGISPILIPLLGSSAAGRARASGLRTYEPADRNIMDNAMSENSLVGFGSQLAREILNPGSLKRDRMDRERAMAVKIAEMKRSRGIVQDKGLIAQVLEMARTGPPLEIPTPAPTGLGNVPIREMSQQQQPQQFAPMQQMQPRSFVTPPRHQPPSLPTAARAQGVGLAIPEAAPPPGYSGPLPPPPPPPPPGYIPEGYRGPIPKNLQLPSFYTQGMKTGRSNAPAAPAAFYPPVLPDAQGKIEGPFPVDGATFKGDFESSLRKEQTPYSPTKDEGYQQGRSDVKSTFMEDSGVMVNDSPKPDSAPPPPAADFAHPKMGLAQETSQEEFTPIGSGGKSSFGGGRGPSESFDDVMAQSQRRRH